MDLIARSMMCMLANPSTSSMMSMAQRQFELTSCCSWLAAMELFGAYKLLLVAAVYLSRTVMFIERKNPKVGP